MQAERQDLTKLLRDNPNVIAAYITDQNSFPQLHIHVKPHTNPDNVKIPTQFARHSSNFHHGPPLQTLICPPPVTRSDHPHQRCQDEPVKLGCQIQPLGAGWVGTAGAPVSWKDNATERRWGILSNWHVMVVNNTGQGHPQHQPTTRQPAIAYLNAWRTVDPNVANHYDAAIADAQHEGFHTIDREILQLGAIAPDPINATQGLPVVKSGRTTAMTQGICTAVGASVRVSYGDFTALFEDQDVFTDVGKPFSAPGDSGSLICCQQKYRATALLFAGGGNLTIGNPIRYIVDAFNLSFNLD